MALDWCSVRRVRSLSAPGLLAVAAMLCIPPTVATGAERNNYFSYTDGNGVLHITNVRRHKGDWKLYKSLPGSAGEARAVGESKRAANPAPARSTTPVRFDDERFSRYDSDIRGAARRYQLPTSLIRAVIHTESNYHPRAVSRAGARGLMQLMPATAKFLGVKDAFEPRQNIYGGARFLRLLANRYDGDMVLVAAAYNAGAGNVEKYGGVPPFQETRNYVRAVLRRYYAYERQAQLARQGARREPARHIAR